MLTLLQQSYKTNIQLIQLFHKFFTCSHSSLLCMYFIALFKCLINIVQSVKLQRCQQQKKEVYKQCNYIAHRKKAEKEEEEDKLKEEVKKLSVSINYSCRIKRKITITIC